MNNEEITTQSEPQTITEMDLKCAKLTEENAKLLKAAQEVMQENKTLRAVIKALSSLL